MKTGRHPNDEQISNYEHRFPVGCAEGPGGEVKYHAQFKRAHDQAGTVRTMSLPPEIWRIIFRNATRVSGWSYITWNFDPDERIWNESDFRDGRRDLVEMEAGTEATAKAIVSVCKAWRNVGVEFLYESIYIRGHSLLDGRHRNTLADIFAASVRSIGGGLSYGWWTKYISCPALLLSATSGAGQLFALLQQCNNLQTIIIRPCTTGAYVSLRIHIQLAQLLESRFRHSLRRAELYLHVPSTDRTQGSTVPEIPGLRTIGLTVRDNTPNIAHDATFKFITTLIIHLPTTSISVFPSQWYFPALRNLTVGSGRWKDWVALAPFFKRHEQTLIHLHISKTNVNLPPSFLTELLRLHTLTFGESGLNSLRLRRQPSTTFPKLTHLGIEPNLDQADYLPRLSLASKMSSEESCQICEQFAFSPSQAPFPPIPFGRIF